MTTTTAVSAPNCALQVACLPNGMLTLEWERANQRQSVVAKRLQEEIYGYYEEAGMGWLLALGFSDLAPLLTPSLSFWRHFAHCFVHHLRLTPEIERLREQVEIDFDCVESAEFMSALPAMVGGEYLTPAQLHAIWDNLHHTFGEKIQAFSGSVADFIHRYRADCHLLGRVYFHLVENKKTGDNFAFLATYAPPVRTPQQQAKHLPIGHALKEYGQDKESLLALLVTVHQAAKHSPIIQSLLENGELFHPLAWSAEEALAFLREIPIYEEAGILCRIPDWWRAGATRVSLNISLGERTPGLVGMQALMSFQPQLLLGETAISEEEARRLLAESEGLALVKNKWVLVDREKLAETLAAYDAARQLAAEQELTLSEAMRLQLNPQKVAGFEDIAIDEVTHSEWFQKTLGALTEPDRLASVTPDHRFQASLRPYQQIGVNWLHSLHTLGFGACLADDMGLGKTIQVLGLLNVLYQEDSAKPPSLLIVPASLLANWSHEISTFFPQLKLFVAHPDWHKPKRVPTLAGKALAKFNLVITTYSLARRYQWISDFEWYLLILDEAQAIKNPGSQQTRAVKAIPAQSRLAMTGTPVENRLSDIWSLFDFVNPGLLGTVAEFKGFAKQLTNEPTGYGRLRQMTSPFILRRLKSDKSIISDLPDKTEIRTWAGLSKKQAVLYQDLVATIEQQFAEAEGIARKGLVFTLLMKCKQLCNHPDQYIGGSSFAEKESGKFVLLRELCEIIHAKRERVLVFTQFKEMAAPLADFLTTVFQQPGLVLHGSVAVGKRKALVAEFQGRDYVPFMILSLKAGGVGLNLTEANHVIHFDRWWNPAVENQATDRAFRIGQKKKVMVHKMITKGTIEEKIDKMLVDKARLAADVVGSGAGQSWLTEMSTQELTQLFRLEI